MRLLKDYAPFTNALLHSICEKVTITSDIPVEQIMKQPKLIVSLNHATALSWIPAIAALNGKVVDSGGGDRLAIGVMDKFFHSNPLTLPLAEYITQSKAARSFDELLTEMQDREQLDLVIFPEGAMTFFGSLDEIHEFRSSRFIELAVRAQVPILLVVHRGSEKWNLGVPLPKDWGHLLMPFSSWLGKGLLGSGILNLPLLLKKIPQFSMHLHLYSPALYESDLAGNPTERRVQLEEEGAKIRELMQEIWNGLPA